MNLTKEQSAGNRPGGAKGSGQVKIPPGRTWLGFLLILLLNYFLVRLIMPGPEEITAPYTVFKQEVEKGNVEAIYSRGETITGRFKAPVTYPPPAGQNAAHARGQRHFPMKPGVENGYLRDGAEQLLDDLHAFQLGGGVKRRELGGGGDRRPRLGCDQNRFFVMWAVMNNAMSHDGDLRGGSQYSRLAAPERVQ